VNKVKMRGNCSFCWYWWNWWPSLFRGRRGRDRMVVGFTAIPMQSVPINTDVVSSNLDQGEVYNIMW